jgi:hypothetical protein
MSAREKKLGLAVIGTALVFALLFGFKVFFSNRLRAMDAQTAALLQQLSKAQATRQTYFKNEEILKALTARTFSDKTELASATSGAMLTQEILRSGLSEANFTRLPVGPRKLHGAEEIGWNVQGAGPLDKVVNLLFVLEKSPYLHRLDNLTLSPADREEGVKVRFNFLTLVILAGPEVEFKELEPKPQLDSPERRQYDLIVQRNLLRPYVEPPPPPPAPSVPPSPGPESFRIVSLSEWQGRPEVHVRDLTQNQTLRYKTGDPLAGGVVIMVDYRPLPKPGQPDLKSFSRVIVKIGSEFWAIEQGQTLAEKYKLAPDQLPPDLPSG